ncbi:MAG: hypothetical protein ACRCZY_07735 [Phocaeicola sp.]
MFSAILQRADGRNARFTIFVGAPERDAPTNVNTPTINTNTIVCFSNTDPFLFFHSG